MKKAQKVVKAVEAEKVTNETLVAAASTRAQQIRTLRNRLSDLADEAASKESFTPAVTALSRVATLDAEVRRCETAAAVALTLDRERQLELMRAQALEDGSMAAASTLTDQLLEERQRRKAEADAEREANERATDPLAQRSALIEALRGLPSDQATIIRESLGWI